MTEDDDAASDSQRRSLEDKLSKTVAAKLWDAARATARKVTLEPAIILVAIMSGVGNGVKVQTNLQLWKICHLELGHNDTLCHNLNSYPNDTVQNEVQIFQNDFAIKDRWVGAGPALAYSVFAGALSDRYGRKPLFVLPVIGSIIGHCFSIVNYAYIRELPMEFFYMDNFFYFFGGASLFYLGTYGYGSDVTTPDERAFRLGIFDGCEMLAYIIGTSLSSPVNKRFGNYGTYVVSIVLCCLSVAYMIIFIKEPKKHYRKTVEDKEAQSAAATASRKSLREKIAHLGKTFFVTPLKEFAETIGKKRDNNLRRLLIVQLLAYSVYWSVAEYGSIIYLYMLKLFDGFEPEQFAQLSVAGNVLNMIVIFCVVPVLSGRLKWHETTCLTLINALNSTSYFAATFPTAIWPGMYLVEVLNASSFSQYSQARSLFSRCVEPNEVGKIFSAVAIITAVMPLASNIAMRKLYSATIDTYPQAFMLYTGALFVLGTALNFYLWTNRSVMMGLADKDVEKESEDGTSGKPKENGSYGASTQSIALEDIAVNGAEVERKGR